MIFKKKKSQKSVEKLIKIKNSRFFCPFKYELPVNYDRVGAKNSKTTNLEAPRISVQLEMKYNSKIVSKIKALVLESRIRYLIIWKIKVELKTCNSQLSG